MNDAKPMSCSFAELRSCGPLEPNLTVHVASHVFYEYMTTGDKSRIKKIITQGILTEEFAYDVESRVIENKQTVDYRPSYPMTTNYLYDTLDRVKEVTYPAQYGLAGNPRKIGVTYGNAIAAIKNQNP